MPYNEVGIDNSVGYGQLLYKPLKVISVRNQALDVEYVEGKDYIVYATSRKIKFPSGSSIIGVDKGRDMAANHATHYPLTNNGEKFNYLGTYDQANSVGWNGTLNNYCEMANVVYTEGTLYLSHYLSITYVYDNGGSTEDNTANTPANDLNNTSTEDMSFGASLGGLIFPSLFALIIGFIIVHIKKKNKRC